jgi:predicted Zn-dependent protease
MIWLAERIAALVVIIIGTQILFSLLRGWWHSQTWQRAALCLLLLGPSSTQAQCDWSKKILIAIQRRYQTNENACKALLASPAEFSQASALVENELLSHFQFVTDPQLDSWLQQHSQKMLSQFNTQPGEQTVRVAAISEPNAFATGQNVTFHEGLVEWYLAPDNVLAQLGYSREQIREFLGQNALLNPGENGIIGVLAHETSHNILGHPDVRPLVLACDDSKSKPLVRPVRLEKV